MFGVRFGGGGGGGWLGGGTHRQIKVWILGLGKK